MNPIVKTIPLPDDIAEKKLIPSSRLKEITESLALEYIQQQNELIKEMAEDLSSSTKYAISVEAENSRLRARLKAYEKAMSDVGMGAKIEDKICQNEFLDLTNISFFHY